MRILTGQDAGARKNTSGSTVNVLGCNMISSGEAELYAIGQGVSEALFVRSMLLESKTARPASQRRPAFTGKKTKHVELRFLFGLLRLAKIEGARNPADLMIKHVATDALQRLKTQLGMVSNWFKDLATDAHDTDDHCSCGACSNASCSPTTTLLGMAHALPCPRVRPNVYHCAPFLWTPLH